MSVFEGSRINKPPLENVCMYVWIFLLYVCMTYATPSYDLLMVLSIALPVIPSSCTKNDAIDWTIMADEWTKAKQRIFQKMNESLLPETDEVRELRPKHMTFVNAEDDMNRGSTVSILSPLRNFFSINK